MIMAMEVGIVSSEGSCHTEYLSADEDKNLRARRRCNSAGRSCDFSD